jgi:8-oxo-dGTP diphosphatase
MYAVALIFNDDGHVLLVRENYGERRYGPPGGGVDEGESPAACCVREAREEAGVDVEVSHLAGIRWAERDEGRFLGFGFVCRIVGGVPTLPTTGEIAELGWFDPENLPQPTTNFSPQIVLPARNGERGLVFEAAF